MTQSMSAATSPAAFAPQGDFPPIDRGRQTSTNAAPANRVYAQHQSAIDYTQVSSAFNKLIKNFFKVPLANSTSNATTTRQPMPPPLVSTSLPKSKM